MTTKQELQKIAAELQAQIDAMPDDKQVVNLLKPPFKVGDVYLFLSGDCGQALYGLTEKARKLEKQNAELSKERDALNETVANLIDLLKAHRQLFAQEGFIDDACQCDDVINNPHNIKAVKAIQAVTIESFASTIHGVAFTGADIREKARLFTNQLREKAKTSE